MTERGHAELGGSSANRWVNCPGSVFLLRELPPQEESEAAKRGTEVHKVCEDLLHSFLQERITGENPEFNCDDVEAHETAEGYVQHVWEKVLEQSLTGKAYGLEDAFVLDENLRMSGYIDFWAVYIDDRAKRVGVIVDFKNGYHSVDVENNSQLAFYACALLEEIRKGGKDLDYVRTVIYQPNDGCEPYREHKYTAKQLDKWKKKFFDAAEVIYVKKKQKYKTGEWCKFCRAQVKCPLYAKELSTRTSLKLVDPDNVELPSPETLPDEIIAKIIEKGDAIESFISACRKYGIERARSGNNLPGLKGVLGTSRRKWKENHDEIGHKILFDTQNAIDPFDSKLRPITAIEKELKTLYPLQSNQKDYLNQFVDMSTPGIILVPEDDPRPAIASSKDRLETYE